MSQSPRFLLINGGHDYHWQEMLTEIFFSMGELRIGTEQEIERYLQKAHYTLVVLDANIVENIPFAITTILSKQPNAKIIVATASPTWTRARDAFQAGAFDYINKSSNRMDIQEMIQNALAKPWQKEGKAKTKV